MVNVQEEEIIGVGAEWDKSQSRLHQFCQASHTVERDSYDVRRRKQIQFFFNDRWLKHSGAVSEEKTFTVTRAGCWRAPRVLASIIKRFTVALLNSVCLQLGGKKKCVLIRTRFNTEQIKKANSLAELFYLFYFYPPRNILIFSIQNVFFSKISEDRHWRRSLSRAALQFWGMCQDLMWHMSLSESGEWTTAVEGKGKKE